MNTKAACVGEAKAIGRKRAVPQVKNPSQTGRASEHKKRISPPNPPHDVPVNISALNLPAIHK
jgi:hypothetical protein